MKQKSKTKLLSWLLILTLLWSMLPTAALAAEDGETWNEAKTLTEDVTLNDGAAVTVSAPVTVTGTVTISGGAGSSFVRGDGYAGVLFIVAEGGSLTLENVTLDGGGMLTSDTWGGRGGDSIVSVKQGGALILNGGAVVQNQYTPTGTALGDNHASGAAIHVYEGGALTMNGGSAVQNGYNAAKDSGAGVCNQGIFTMNGGTVSGFTLATSNGTGGGVCNLGTFTMEGGTISGNSAATYGGGVSNGALGAPATFTLRGGKISGNAVTGITGVAQCGGGGVYNQKTFIMEGGSIAQNTVAYTSGTYDNYDGGGVFLDRDSSFTMSGGEITQNKAGVTVANTVSSYSRGGGLMVFGGTATLIGGTIANNQAGEGGGIFQQGGTLSMKGGCVSKNEVSAHGGGVMVLLGTASINGGSISGNEANSGYGGGIFQQGGTLTMTPTADTALQITENTALQGGGIAVYSGSMTFNGGTVCENTAEYGGGFMLSYYPANPATATINGGSITGNQADSGGGVYAAMNAKLFGGLISGNTLTGSGKGPNVEAAASCYINGGIQIPSGLSIAKDKFLAVNDALTSDARLGVILEAPPISVSSPVAVALKASGSLTDADLSHFTYDGPNCVLKLGNGENSTNTGKIYAYLSATKPSATIDYEVEQLKNLPTTGSFTVNGGEPITESTGALNIATGWFNTTLQLVKKGESDISLDSVPQSLPIPARPDKPDLTVTPVSRPGLTDGAISGVTAAMEHSSNNGTSWTAITADKINDGKLTGLAAGDYLFRVKASNANKNFRSESTAVKLPAAPYAVLDTPLDIKSDSAKLGGSVTKGSGQYNAALSYRAAGAMDWIALSSENCTADKTYSSVEVSSLQPDTLYEVRLTATDENGLSSEAGLRFRTAPVGVQPQGSIEATVTGGDRDVVVSIQHGNVTLASVAGHVDTGSSFTATFTGLEDGVYNVVCESTGYVETRSVTMLRGDASENPAFALPTGLTNTVVKIQSEETPPAAVHGLPALITADDKSAVEHGGSIEYALLVEKKDETAERAEDIKEKAAADGKEDTLFYLDFSMVKTSILSGRMTAASITETAEILEIAFPIPTGLTGKRNLTVYRAHGGEPAEALTKLTDRPSPPTEEGFCVDNKLGYLFVYAQKFSTYAIAYEAAPGGGPSGGHSSYTLIYESNGGTVFPAELYRAGTVVKLTNTPVREGFTFLGWYGDKALTKPVAEVKMTENLTVYADWERTETPDLLNGEDHFAYVMGRSNGLVHPEADITRAEVAQIFYRLLRDEVRGQYESTQNSFPDVPETAWFNEAVSTLTNAGIIAGRPDGTFGPNLPITRAEFATIAARSDSEPYDGADLFTDIGGHWARSYINQAAARGWVLGEADGAYRPDDPISRAEAMTIINRVLQRLPESADALLPGMKTWPDNADPDKWYYLPVQEATNSHDYRRTEDGGEIWTKLV